MLEYGMREWGASLKSNPVSGIAIPREGKSRDRRITPEELELILRLSDSLTAPFLYFGIILAIETGMRRGELLSALWGDLDLEKSLLTIRQTKNGGITARRIIKIVAEINAHKSHWRWVRNLY